MLGKTVGFIGAGNLAEALIKGFLASRIFTPGQVLASDQRSERLLRIAEKYEVKVFSKNFEVARFSDIILVTVKPGDVSAVLKDIAAELKGKKLLISAAAGIKTGTIIETLRAEGLASLIPIVRAMPNTPVMVGEGAIALTAGSSAGKEELEEAARLFESVGKVVVVEDETLMDAVTALSGSGPAYIFYVLEALVEGGVSEGLPPDKAKVLAVQTALGAARLALESTQTLAELRRMVTSPGGTTEAGLKKLEEKGVKKALVEAVLAATKRSRELSSA